MKLVEGDRSLFAVCHVALLALAALGPLPSSFPRPQLTLISSLSCAFLPSSCVGGERGVWAGESSSFEREYRTSQDTDYIDLVGGEV